MLTRIFVILLSVATPTLAFAQAETSTSKLEIMLALVIILLIIVLVLLFAVALYTLHLLRDLQVGEKEKSFDDYIPYLGMIFPWEVDPKMRTLMEHLAR